MRTNKDILLRRQSGGFDRLLFVLIIALTLIGLFFVADSSTIQAQSSFGDKFFYIKGQLAAAAVGLCGFLASIFIPLRFWEKLAIPLFLVTLVLLFLVFIPGIGINVLGAKRWINLAGFNFQPAELAKLTLLLYLARALSRETKLIPFFLATLLFTGLIVIEPDFGTASVLMLTSLTMLFMSGASIFLFMVLFPVAAAAGALLVWFSGYRRERLLTFLGQMSDPLTSSYHISQVLLAISSGGILGVGLGQSRAKYLFLPEATTDSIFAIVAEEFGFVGALLFLSVFILIVARMFRIARTTQNPFGKLVAAGVAAWIGIQAFINVAAMTATLPITGIPLPFISYGGTALVIILIASGIVLGISRSEAVAAQKR